MTQVIDMDDGSQTDDDRDETLGDEGDEQEEVEVEDQEIDGSDEVEEEVEAETDSDQEEQSDDTDDGGEIVEMPSEPEPESEEDESDPESDEVVEDSGGEAEVEAFGLRQLKREATPLEGETIGEAIRESEYTDDDFERQPFLWNDRVFFARTWGCMECTYRRIQDEEMDPRDPPEGGRIYGFPAPDRPEREGYICGGCDREVYAFPDTLRLSMSFGRRRTDPANNFQTLVEWEPVIGYLPPEGLPEDKGPEIIEAMRVFWVQNAKSVLFYTDMLVDHRKNRS